MTENKAFGKVSEDQLDSMVAEVTQAGARTVMIYCTNLRAAQRAAHWEKLHNCVILDSVASVVWSMLRRMDIDMSSLRDWGSMFAVR